MAVTIFGQTRCAACRRLWREHDGEHGARVSNEGGRVDIDITVLLGRASATACLHAPAQEAPHAD